MEPQLSRTKLWLFRGVMLLVALLALELFARGARVLMPVHDEGYGYPKDLYVADPDCDYRCRPRYRGFFEGPLYSAIPIEINSHGFRDDEFPAALSPGAVRVAFLGDSVVFGSGVRAEDRFTAQLRGAAPPARYETLNLAINSYSAWHYAAQVRAVVPAFQPGHVVVGLCLNDLEPKSASWPSRRVSDAKRAKKAERLHASDYSALAGIAKEMKSRWRDRDPWRTWMRHIGGLWQDPELEGALRGHLTQIRDALSAREIALTVLVLPERHDLEDPERFGLPRRRALALLGELAIPHIDLYEVFRAEPDRLALFLQGDSIHLSPRGHALVAAQLESWLARPQPSTPLARSRSISAASSESSSRSTASVLAPSGSAGAVVASARESRTGSAAPR